MTTLVFRAAAIDDVREALDWYRSQSAIARDGLADELEALLTTVESAPLAYPALYRDVRRALTQRFPYAVYLITEGERVIVLRVLHQRRSPRIWPRGR